MGTKLLSLGFIAVVCVPQPVAGLRILESAVGQYKFHITHTPHHLLDSSNTPSPTIPKSKTVEEWAICSDSDSEMAASAAERERSPHGVDLEMWTKLFPSVGKNDLVKFVSVQNAFVENACTTAVSKFEPRMQIVEKLGIQHAEEIRDLKQQLCDLKTSMDALNGNVTKQMIINTPTPNRGNAAARASSLDKSAIFSPGRSNVLLFNGDQPLKLVDAPVVIEKSLHALNIPKDSIEKIHGRLGKSFTIIFKEKEHKYGNLIFAGAKALVDHIMEMTYNGGNWRKNTFERADGVSCTYGFSREKSIARKSKETISRAIFNELCTAFPHLKGGEMEVAKSQGIISLAYETLFQIGFHDNGQQRITKADDEKLKQWKIDPPAFHEIVNRKCRSSP
jgi:hypothetical protein